MPSSFPAIAAASAPSLTDAPVTQVAPESLPDLAFRGTLSPAAELVLLGARTRLEGARRARFDELLGAGASGAGASGAGASGAGASGASVNWAEVKRLASAHRVLGLLGRHLSARAWSHVSPPVAAEIQNYFVRVMAHSQALKVELARVSQLLEEAGIAVVSFKGPTLGLAAYGNSVVRPSADLDLLVARAHVERARALLQRAGYAPEIAISSQQAQIALRVDSVFNLFRPAPAPLRRVLPQGYCVELHWAISAPCLPFDFEFPDVAPNLSWIALPGVPGATNAIADESATSGAAFSNGNPSAMPARWFEVRALSPEDLLLILLVHGAKHLWERLIWLCDVAELIAATPDLDWPRVLEAAHKRGVQRMTALGLALARDVLGLALPREVEAWLSTQPQALRLAAQLRRQLLTRAPHALSDEGHLAGHVAADDALLMQTIDTHFHRLGFLWHLATAPPLRDRAALNLPAGLDFLWYVLRPARALQKRLRAKPRAE